MLRLRTYEAGTAADLRQTPGPIDNGCLFAQDGNPLPNLRAGRDYCAFSERVRRQLTVGWLAGHARACCIMHLPWQEWRCLHETYGGGPVIARRTMNIYDECHKWATEV